MTRSTLLSDPRLYLFLAVLVLASLPAVSAFGAGNVPNWSFSEGSSFRHGDLEDILVDLLKKTGGGLLSRGSKFSGLDVKRVYFGNWLRDYSQAMDVAALQKLKPVSILSIVMVLGFMAHGYVTEEFQVTDERLGVYLPTEHIDNPKGYADNKDAREYDRRLRGPVDPRELEIDPRSGMKNYIANESGNWDTSSALVRRTLTQCIEMGRRARSTGRVEDLYEAYRLLGQALHTLEDLPAHSNWCELALLKLGFRDVFCHVGDNVRVQAPGGERVPPLVTGTFGSADFMHSLLGEAQDHLSEASVSDLSKAVEGARSQQGGSRGIGEGGSGSAFSNLMGLLNSVPGGPDGSVSRDIEDLSRAPAGGVENMSPEEMYQNLWRILSLRDRIMKSIEQTIEKIPGLDSLLESASNAISVFIFTTLEPYLKPLVTQAMTGLSTGSAQVIKKEDQFEVFNDPNASDPTHSMLAKDHFAKILNEVAGNVAKIIVKHTVNNVVKAWDDQRASVDQIVDESLACMFHPYWHHPQAIVQREMLEYIESWSRTHHNEIRRLDRQNCRNHTDTRTGKAEEHSHGHGGGGNNNNQVPGGVGGKFGAQAAGAFSNYMGNKVQGMMPQQFGSREAGEGGGESASYYGGGGGDGGEGRGHGQSGSGVGGGGDYGRNESEGYGGHRAQGSGGGGGYGGNEGGYRGNEGGYRPQQPEPQRYGGGGDGGYRPQESEPQYGSGGGGGGYGAPPSMPNERHYLGGGGNDGGYPGAGGYGGQQQQGPPDFPAPSFGGGNSYDGGNNQSMYPGQQQQQQGQYPGQQQQGWNPPQNQGYGGGGGNYQQY